jgi:dTMP kinase
LASQGVFISFEGIDGSGKTTQLRRLREVLEGRGHAVTVAQEPGGTRVGREIRRLLLDKANSDLRTIPELLLYFASRAQNIEEVILPALEAGAIVLADRFTDATVAYQGHGRQLGVEVVRDVERVACHDVKPDLTLLLDIDPETGLERALERNENQTADESRMERQSLDFYRRVQAGYRELSETEPDRIVVIDARGGVEDVAEEVQSQVLGFLEARGAVV